MRQASVPQPPDDRKAVVDDLLVDGGLAQLDRSVEELGDQQVLPVWGELHKPVRDRAGQPGALHQRQGVVLLLDQPPHRVERLLVLSRPYSSSRPSLYQRSARRWLCAYSLANSCLGGSPLTVMRSGVEPAEPASPKGLICWTARPSWSSRPRRIATPARRPRPGARCGPPVDDREDLAWGEPPEGQEGDADGDADREEHVGWGFGAQRDPGDGDQRH
jgi:hypothetical protein